MEAFFFGEIEREESVCVLRRVAMSVIISLRHGFKLRGNSSKFFFKCLFFGFDEKYIFLF